MDLNVFEGFTHFALASWRIGICHSTTNHVN
jgi:hypothetical protein